MRSMARVQDLPVDPSEKSLIDDSVPTVAPDAPLSVVLGLLRESERAVLAVVDAGGKYIGTITPLRLIDVATGGMADTILRLAYPAMIGDSLAGIAGRLAAAATVPAKDLIDPGAPVLQAPLSLGATLARFAKGHLEVAVIDRAGYYRGLATWSCFLGAGAKPT
ncbi:MAG: CBS domain-containing protein [Alphaproteobacteria bacterium]|nr:CBS domain-containing protein [Alphaproteobacteria bacterium]